MIFILGRNVTLIKGQKNLHEDLPYDIFGDKVLLSPALLDELCHVSILAVFHDNQQLLLFLQNDLVVIAHNI